MPRGERAAERRLSWAERRELMEGYLYDEAPGAVSVGEAEAMVSPGYRSEGWDPARRGHQAHDAEGEARFCRAVERRVDAWPWYLLKLVPPALAQELCESERLVLELLCKRELTLREVEAWFLARGVRLSHSTIGRMKARAIDKLVAAVWDDDGRPRREAAAA
jgi:hypothetical protein